MEQLTEAEGRRIRLTQSDLLVWGVAQQQYRRGVTTISEPAHEWCRATGISRATYWRSMRRLEAAGLVERRQQYEEGESELWAGREHGYRRYNRRQVENRVWLTPRGRMFCASWRKRARPARRERVRAGRPASSPAPARTRPERVRAAQPSPAPAGTAGVEPLRRSTGPPPQVPGGTGPPTSAEFGEWTAALAAWLDAGR